MVFPVPASLPLMILNPFIKMKRVCNYPKDLQIVIGKTERLGDSAFISKSGESEKRIRNRNF